MFFWMLPLALLPVLFHLFMRVRKQTRPVPSLLFFLQADPRLSARKKIREWLTLLLRVLAIAFLLLALSRPVWRAVGGGGSAAQLLVIDNSGSMSGTVPDGKVKLAMALDAVAAMVADMREADSMALLLLVDDPAAAVPEGFVADRETLRAALGRIRETQASGSPARVLEQAFLLAAGSSLPRREIHLFTDLQEDEWGGGPPGPRTLPANTRLLVHRIGSQPFAAANVAIGGIELPNKRLVAGRRYLANVTLNNASKSAAHLRLDANDQTGATSSQQVDVAAHSTRVVSVPFDTRNAGTGWLGVDIEHDAFQQDNHAFAVFACQDKKKVVFLGGRGDFGNLPLAVSPSGDGLLSGLVPVFTRTAAALAGELKSDCAMVVVRWSAWPAGSEAGALRNYVEKGGNLLVVPDQAPAAVTGDGIPAWVGSRPQGRIVSVAGLPLVAAGGKSAVWDDLREESGEIAFRQLKVFQAETLDVAPGGRPLLTLENGSPLLVESAVGAGKVYASGMRFDVTSSNLPVKGGFVALVHSLALSAMGQAGGGSSLLAGARAPGVDGREQEVRMHTLAGAVLEWQGRGEELPAFARSGVYRVDAGKKSFVVAVRSADAEGRESYLSAAPVPVLAGLAHRVDEYRDRESFISRVRRMRVGIDLYLPLLLLALAAVLFEGWVINAGARRVPSGTGAKTNGSS